MGGGTVMGCLLPATVFAHEVRIPQLHFMAGAWYSGSEICAAKLLLQTVLLLRHQHRGSDPDWSLDMLFENDY